VVFVAVADAGSDVDVDGDGVVEVTDQMEGHW